MCVSQTVTPEGLASPQRACNQDGTGGPQSGSFCTWVGRSELWLPSTPEEETVLTQGVEAHVFSSRKSTGLLESSGHSWSRGRAAASLGLCIISDV